MTKRFVLGDISEDQNGNAVIDTLEGDIYIDNGRLILEAPPSDEIEFLSDVLADIADIASQLDIPNYSDPANAPNETVLYDSTAERIKYKTSSGTVVSAGGVENPLTETLDADGNDITNVGALETEDAAITNFSTGATYDVWMPADSNDIYAFDSGGELVAGGTDNRNVTDSTDLGQILDYLLNTHSASHSTIRFGQSPDDALPGAFTAYPIDTPVTTESAFTMVGNGTNRAVVETSSGAAGEDVLTITGGAAIEFHNMHFRTNDHAPTRWVNVNGGDEIVGRGTEWRDATEWQVEITTTDAVYNEFIGCWFADGANPSLRVANAADFRLIGNRFAGDVEIVDSNNIIRRGNEFMSNETLTNVGFVRPNESFGRVSTTNTTIGKHNVGDITEYRDDLVTVTGGSTQTIFDETEAVDVIGGYVTGPAPARLEATWDDGTTDQIVADSTEKTTGRTIDDSNPGPYATMNVPELKDVQTLTFDNALGSDREYGWAVQAI